MYANSSIPESAQQGVHEHLAQRVAKHASSEFRKPYLDYNKAAFEASLAGWDGKAPLILDAGCGVGHSTIQLAREFPDYWVIGVDQSEDRLSRKKPYPDALIPKNMVFVRADLVDYWRLMADAGITLARMMELGFHGMLLECRSNWNIYVEEFVVALGLLIGREVKWESFEAPSPLTPFERKYRDSGQTLYRCVVELDHTPNLEHLPS